MTKCVSCGGKAEYGKLCWSCQRFIREEYDRVGRRLRLE